MFKNPEEDEQVWKITETLVPAEDGALVETYGVRINDTVINDVSPNKQEIEAFIIRLNKLGASELHAYELVEDFLGR